MTTATTDLRTGLLLAEGYQLCPAPDGEVGLHGSLVWSKMLHRCLASGSSIRAQAGRALYAFRKPREIDLFAAVPGRDRRPDDDGGLTVPARTTARQRGPAQPGPLVRYVSPFRSPAWMTRERAEHYVAEDDDLYQFLCLVERETGSRVLADVQRRIGPPRIEIPR